MVHYAGMVNRDLHSFKSRSKKYQERLHMFRRHAVSQETLEISNFGGIVCTPCRLLLCQALVSFWHKSCPIIAGSGLPVGMSETWEQKKELDSLACHKTNLYMGYILIVFNVTAMSNLRWIHWIHKNRRSDSQTICFYLHLSAVHAYILCRFSTRRYQPVNNMGKIAPHGAIGSLLEQVEQVTQPGSKPLPSGKIAWSPKYWRSAFCDIPIDQLLYYHTVE